MSDNLIQNSKHKITPLSVAKRVALIAVSTALIECGKLALAVIPNVEVVTLLCALLGYAFGLYGVISVYLFVVIEPLIWGFGTWLISYLIYWPLVAVIFMLFGIKNIKNRIIVTFTACVLTALFGVLTSLVDIGLFSGKFDNFWTRFAIYYSRGAVFYIVQIACNLVLFATAFTPLSRILKDVRRKF